MNVLSLFDGCSVGQLALSEIEVDIDQYFASEIDRHAIAVTQRNFPKTTQVGDVRLLDVGSLPPIDLLIGGTPCTNFSFMGKQRGMVTKSKISIESLDKYLALKDEGFEFEGESYLFWEYIRILNEVKPKYFLLENVVMDAKWESIISSTLGCPSIRINSSLVSAQNRPRLYWTNIPNVSEPSDRGVVLKDMLRDVDNDDQTLYIDRDFIPATEIRKSPNGLIFVGGVSRPSGKGWGKSKGVVMGNFSSGYRVFSIDGKFSTITASGGGLSTGANLLRIGDKVRKISIIERERLQTLPDGYTEGVSEPQRRKIIGNGWTLEIIKHIFENLKTSS